MIASGHFITPANRKSLPARRRVPFTHMGPADTKVWQAALDEKLVQADSFEYDLRLGGGIPTELAATDPHDVMWKALIKKRVDVVAWQGKTPLLIEVKTVASFSALGQALGYGYLWEKEKPRGVKPRLGVVCAICDFDLRPAFAFYGVQVYELPLQVAERLLSPHSGSLVETAS